MGYFACLNFVNSCVFLIYPCFGSVVSEQMAWRANQEGLDIVASQRVDLVICAWVSTGMSGPEFCRALRAEEREQYLYIILLTTKTETSEIADGLAAGADDFLSKPVNGTELAARIQAAQRLLVVERQLTEKNRLVNETLSELTTLYEALDRDLVEARKLQQSLVRKSGSSLARAVAPSNSSRLQLIRLVITLPMKTFSRNSVGH